MGNTASVASAISAITTALLILALTDASIQDRESILTNDNFLASISVLDNSEVEIMYISALRATCHFGNVDSYHYLINFIDKHWYNKVHSSHLRDSFFYIDSFNSNTPMNLGEWSLLIRGQKNIAEIINWVDFLEDRFKQKIPTKGQTPEFYSTLLICDLISHNTPQDRCEFVLKKSHIFSEQDKEATITSMLAHNRLDLLEWVRSNQPDLLFPDMDIRLDTVRNRNSSLLKRLSSIMNTQSISSDAVSFFTKHMINLADDKWLIQAISEFKDIEGNLETYELKNLSILRPAL